MVPSVNLLNALVGRHNFNSLHVLLFMQTGLFCLFLHHPLKVDCDTMIEEGKPQVEMIQDFRAPSTVQGVLGDLYTQSEPFRNINRTLVYDGNKLQVPSLHRYTFICTAPYLTRWTSSIVAELPAAYTPASPLTANPFLRNSGPTIRYNGSELERMYQSQLIFALPIGRSGWVHCESIGNETAKRSTRVYLYTLDGPDLVQSYGQTAQSIFVTRQTYPLLAPCTANYPNITAQFQSTDNVTQVGTVEKYSPFVGFEIKGVPVLSFIKARNVVHVQCSAKDQINTYKFYLQVTDETNAHLPSYFEKLNLRIGNLDDGYPLGLYCYGDYAPRFRFLRMINCNSKDECDWLRPCIEQNCTLNGIISKLGIPFPLPTRDYSDAAIPDPYTRGLVHCQDRYYEFILADYLFTGLDRQRYWLSKSSEIPLQAIIQITETNRILYTNRPTFFRCETVNFLLISNIQFALQYKNGSKVLVNGASSKDTSLSSLPQPSDVLVDSVLGFSSKQIVLNLTTEVVGISCFAPWNNSTNWINTTREFEVRDVQAPVIAVSNSKEQSSKKFRIGDSTRSLFCNISGEPRPLAHWTIPLELERSFIDFDIKLDEFTLQFPNIDETFKGDWKFICNAKNDYGSVSHTFDVTILDEVDPLSSAALAGIVIASLVFIAMIAGLIIFIRKYNEAKKQLRDLTPEEIDEFRKGNPERLRANGGSIKGNECIQWLGFDGKLELAESDLIIAKDSILGEGEYGRVYRGFLKDEAVAVKTTKPTAEVSYVKALLSELKIMAYIGTHSNIAVFRGAVLTQIKERIVYVVLELSPFGCLLQVLRKMGKNYENVLTSGTADGEPSNQGTSAPNGSTTLVYYCRQIADAMQYLAEKQVIHGDLAARNILVYKDNVVKVTDFGLSKQLYGYEKFTKTEKTPLPWAWMAIESLQYQEFSCQTDVWSFGVTAWEIFSLGQSPYSGLRWTPEFVNELNKGMRLTKPSRVTPKIYDKLLECWHLEPQCRPSFSDLFVFFGEMMEAHLKEFPVDIQMDSGVNSTAYTVL